MNRPALWALLALACGVAGFAPAPLDAQPVRGWHYRMRFDEALASVDVQLCFENYLPRRLVSVGGNTLEAFSFDAPQGGGPSLTPARDGGGVRPVGLRPGGCVSYRVDLTAILRSGRGGRNTVRVGRDVLVPPGLLFLQPALWPAGAQVTVAFEMPAGMRAAVPWPSAGAAGVYRLEQSALGLRGLAAFGRFPVDTLQVAGTTLDVALLDAPCRATQAGIHAWLSGAVSAVADLFGRFPSPRVTVLVHPVPARRPAVVFGQALRAGGSHVHLLLAAAAGDEELPGEWVAVHEMIHLGMPWTFNSEAWLQEGFVTYYQEVLRARAGFLSEQEAWQNIHEGFGRGRLGSDERPLRDDSREMGRLHNYWRVYWAGAAIALRIDVELRRQSAGRRSLDDVMRWMHERHGMRAPQRGVDLLRAVDAWLGRSLCAVVAESCLGSSAFPDVSATYAALGLDVVGGRVVLRDDAPQAQDRARIMRPASR